MTTIGSDHATLLALGMLFYYVSIFSEKCSGLHGFDGLIQALSCSFNDSHRVWVCFCLVAYIVGLV